MIEENRGSYMRTFTGKMFYPASPHPMQICIEDIAHGLSNLCRFAGQTREFYSVAQHSVLVSRALRSLPEIGDRVIEMPSDRRLARAALLHDAAEAYIVDLPSPVKYMVSGYGALEHAVERAICARLSLDMHDQRIDVDDLHHPLVKRCDLLLLGAEKRDLFDAYVHRTSDAWEERVRPWTPAAAETEFLHAFRELFTVPHGR